MRMKDIDKDFLNKEVHVWFIDLINKPITVNKNILSEEELERAQRFKVNEPKKSFLICRYALRCLLGYYLNIEPNKIVFEYNQFGKPYLKVNKYIETIHFNLSHCQNIGCITVTKNNTIGVDVEKIESSLIEMAHTFMAKEEIDTLHLFQHNKDTILYHLWVQKEAILKAKGTGLQILPTDIQGFVTPEANLRNELIDDFYVNTFHLHPNILAVGTPSKVNVKFFQLEDLLGG